MASSGHNFPTTAPRTTLSEAISSQIQPEKPSIPGNASHSGGCYRSALEEGPGAGVWGGSHENRTHQRPRVMESTAEPLRRRNPSACSLEGRGDTLYNRV